MKKKNKKRKRNAWDGVTALQVEFATLWPATSSGRQNDCTTDSVVDVATAPFKHCQLEHCVFALHAHAAMTDAETHVTTLSVDGSACESFSKVNVVRPPTNGRW